MEQPYQINTGYRIVQKKNLNAKFSFIQFLYFFIYISLHFIYNKIVVMQVLQHKSRKKVYDHILTTTADVSNVLKVLNKNSNWKNSSTKFNKTINTKNLTTKNITKNIMTEQDLDKLFSRSKSKNKTQITNNLTQSWLQKPKDLTTCAKFLHIQDDYDKLLTGMLSTKQSNDLQKIESLFKQQTNDLTVQFKKNYLVGKIVGEGAYASVRVAIYKPLNKKIAIKVYEKLKIKETQKKKSVRREIKILQSLNHPNIVRIHDVVQTNNHLNIIMQYLPGISLNNFIKGQPNNKTPEKTCKKILKSLTQALKYMHSKQIAHRDIKLENVILDQQNNPKLIDFGFSTCLQYKQKVKIFCGTPSYMAPEIVQKRQYRGQPADIWALGVLFFVILTGIFPFKGATDQELYKKINSADYPRSELLHSKQITDLINMMLRINSDQRITAAQILEHPWMKERSASTSNCFKKMKKSQNSFDLRKKTVTSSHKSRQKQSSNTRKLTETCKQNLRLELRMIKQSSTGSNNKFNKTCTQRKMQNELSKCGQRPQKIRQKSSSQNNKQNTMNNLTKTNAKVLDLLKMQIKRRTQEKSKAKTRRF